MTPQLHSLERAPKPSPAAKRDDPADDWFAQAQQRADEARLQKDDDIARFLEDALGRDRLDELDEELERRLELGRHRPLLSDRDRIGPAARELEPAAAPATTPSFGMI
jgi:hypothetical protein